VSTRERDSLFTLNGVQTQSARVCNLIHALPDMQALGVDVVRISPSRGHTLPVAELFKRGLEQPAELASLARQLDALIEGPACNGFWHGIAGMSAVGHAGAAA